jgi:amidase
MHLDEYTRFDAVGLAELVRRKEVTPAELLEAALAANARVNPRINAVIGTWPDEARAAVERGLPEGPFRGVPFLLKDLVLHAAGVATDLGSRLTRGTVFPHDSALMERYRRAGLVMVGRTNTPEFGANASTEPVLHGPTRNPWNLERSAGGSSGGSAAAVAAGIVPMAYANDGGGSIRIPAAHCGLFGLKPTRNRISVGPDAGEALNGMGSEHVVSRSVRDSAAMLDATHGPALGDPYLLAPPERPYLEEVRRKPGRLRIALSRTAFSGAPVSPECVAAVEDAARLCTELGHEVVEATPKFDYPKLEEAMVTVWGAGIAAWADGLAGMLGRTPGPDNLEAVSWALLRYGRGLKATDLLGALAVFNHVSRTVAPFFAAHDVLLTPTTAVPPYALGVLDMNVPRSPAEWFHSLFKLIPFTALFNVTGQPAMSVPLSWSADGLPLGLQFVGRWGEEGTLFRLAGQLEEARPWAERRPPVHAAKAA